jgi:hypothetical protein
MTEISTEQRLDEVREFFAQFPRIAEKLLGYPARLMSAAEFREAYWRIWPEATDPEDVQTLHFLSEWFAKTVPHIEKSSADTGELFAIFTQEYLNGGTP